MTRWVIVTIEHAHSAAWDAAGKALGERALRGHLFVVFVSAPDYGLEWRRHFVFVLYGAR